VPTAPVTGLWYPKKDLGEPVATGELLGEIRTVFGETLASIRSENEGFILYRLTSLSVNEKEALLGVGTPV
jgi:predicted deacylase